MTESLPLGGLVQAVIMDLDDSLGFTEKTIYFSALTNPV
jgi:hypothetical protein